MTKPKWYLLFALLLLPALAFAGGQGGGAKPGGPVTLEFVTWDYSIDLILENIKTFEQANPDIKVNHTGYSWNVYHDTMVLRFKGKTQTDVFYNGEDWLPEWAAAGWVVSLEDYFPDAKKYKDATASYALADMTYNGKLYGLSYYADLITFQYNKKILGDNGMTAPKDWNEVLQDSLKLKQGGMTFPFVYEFAATLPNFYSAFVSQVYGRGGDMFDKDLNPVFNNPNGEAFKQLQWLQDANVKHKIMAFNDHETKVIISMNTGEHAFSVLYNYVLGALNGPQQPLSGQFDMVEMPGSKHACLGFAKFYCMTAQAAENEARRNAAWRFIEAFGGGDYWVAKRWAVDRALGFAQLPLFDDPDVQKAFSSWIDVEKYKNQAKLARNATNTEWKGMWSEFFRPLMAKAFVGDASVKEVMDQGAAKWNEYKKLLGK
jgi:multiple sugar transport system substrate-binding protein